MCPTTTVIFIRNFIFVRDYCCTQLSAGSLEIAYLVAVVSRFFFSCNAMQRMRVFIKDFYFCIVYFPKGEWADPGGSAIPGQPVARTEQAPIPWPSCKNQFNIQAPQWGAFQILSWKEQILHMILAKRPRSDNFFTVDPHPKADDSSNIKSMVSIN